MGAILGKTDNKCTSSKSKPDFSLSLSQTACRAEHVEGQMFCRKLRSMQTVVSEKVIHTQKGYDKKRVG
jgi:hypothetical protein